VQYSIGLDSLMIPRNRRNQLFLAAAFSIFASHPVLLDAQAEAAHSRHALPNIELVDQHGKKIHFYSDLVRGKVVAINTIFTTCTTICPLMGANFSQLSRILGDESHGKVSLISISIDAAVDTPEQLDRWSRTFGKPGPDWTLVTGAKPDIDNLLKALEVFTAEKLDHAPVVLIGDGTGPWVRASALQSPARLADLIRARLDHGAVESTSRR
jgi:protein SCO1